jgi:hypothetical protein
VEGGFDLTLRTAPMGLVDVALAPGIGLVPVVALVVEPAEGVADTVVDEAEALGTGHGRIVSYMGGVDSDGWDFQAVWLNTPHYNRPIESVDSSKGLRASPNAMHCERSLDLMNTAQRDALRVNDVRVPIYLKREWSS